MELEEGMIASLIGPNGAGKTAVQYFDRPLPARRRRDSFPKSFFARLEAGKITGAGISRTFQNIRLFSHMTVLENVLVGMQCAAENELAGDSLQLKTISSAGK